MHKKSYFTDIQRGNLIMNKHIMNIISIMAAAALCASNTTAIVSDSVADTVSAADEQSSPQNVVLKNGSRGEIGGAYFVFSGNPGTDQMELISPALFKAKWGSAATDGSSSNAVCSRFERGKLFGERNLKGEEGYGKILCSSVDYQLDFDVNGSCYMGPHLSFSGKGTDSLSFRTDVHIIDASTDWQIPDSAQYKRDIDNEGSKYDLYEDISTTTTPERTDINEIFYFVSKDAESNGKTGSVSASYDLAPFISEVSRCTANINNSISMTIELCGVRSDGTAELVRNNMNIPEVPLYNTTQEYTDNVVSLKNRFISDQFYQQRVRDKIYLAKGNEFSMKGDPDNGITCRWNSADPEEEPAPDFRYSSFHVEKTYSNYDPAAETGSFVYEGDDEILMDYSIDAGPVSKKSENGDMQIGAAVQCMRKDDSVIDPSSHYAEQLTKTSTSYIYVLDKWELSSMPFIITGQDYDLCYEPIIEAGSFTSEGVKYNVRLAVAKSRDMAFNCAYVVRDEALAPTEAEDVPDGYTRYENSINITDIVSKVRELGIDFGGIMNAQFTFTAYDSEGTALINHADVTERASVNRSYTAEDIQQFKDYLLGRTDGKDISFSCDLNGDGAWDIYDLCIMRDRLDVEGNK